MIKRIKDVISKQINSKIEIEDDIDIKVYGIDSLKKVQLLVDLEDEFKIEFDEDDIRQENFCTVLSIKSLLEKYANLRGEE